MLDIGMVMYAGLLILAVWRSVCYYQCCGVWLSFLNYISLLYVLLGACAIYSLREFYRVVAQPVDEHVQGDVWEVKWLMPFALFAPIGACLTLALSWFQAEAHVFEIRKQVGKDKHDRAVQIIALPAVFAVMVMAALVPIVLYITGNMSPDMLDKPLGVDVKEIWNDKVKGAFSGKGNMTAFQPTMLEDQVAFFINATTDPNPYAQDWNELEKVALWRYETCFYVADLFEAWALYQFGCMMLELIEEAYNRRGCSEELLKSHAAVQSLTWLATTTFVLVCSAQTACSLWPYIGGAEVEEKLQLIMTSFQVAGFFASGAAIYNVFIVERSFHTQLAACAPVLKFLSVKILVSLSFFQRGLLVVLQICNGLLPGMVRRLVMYVPIVGDILNLTQVQMHIFYPALIQYECLLAALIHIWAWRSQEEWYTAGVVEHNERQPLMDSSQKSLKV